MNDPGTNLQMELYLFDLVGQLLKEDETGEGLYLALVSCFEDYSIIFHICKGKSKCCLGCVFLVRWNFLFVRSGTQNLG